MYEIPSNNHTICVIKGSGFIYIHFIFNISILWNYGRLKGTTTVSGT